LWAQLSMIARLVVAWQVLPPVSNEFGVEDRCEQGEAADPALAERLNVEIGRLQRAAGGRFAQVAWSGGGWSGMAAEMAPVLASAEVSLACGLSRTGSDRLVDASEALFMQGRLPRLRRLLHSGWVEWAKLDWFVRDTAHLDVVVANAVERIVLGDLAPDTPDAPGAEPGEELDVLADPTRPGLGLPRIVSMTVPELRAAIAAAVAAIDAEGAERAAWNARAARRVRCQANQDGTATLTTELAVEAAAAVWNALTAGAKAAKAAGDPRSLDQLRADELLARTTGTPQPPPAPGDTPDPTQDANGVPDAASDDRPGETGDRASGEDTGPADAESTDAAGAAETVAVTDATGGSAGSADGGACHACGQEPGQARWRRAGRPLSVSLTLPLASYVGMLNDPGRLDGFGPVAAVVARQIIDDATRNSADAAAGITWRCAVVDDVHGTVLGVGSPVRVPRHDPPPRLADLVRASEPTCCFPGCRICARDCDLDHRIPYNPEDPTGQHGGGATCSCNLQPLCRGHHRLKTTGLIDVRVLTDRDDADQAGQAPIVPGTLEFTTATGLCYRRPPTPGDATSGRPRRFRGRARGRPRPTARCSDRRCRSRDRCTACGPSSGPTRSRSGCRSSRARRRSHRRLPGPRLAPQLARAHPTPHPRHR
jgi:hypothetical protein